MFDDLARELRKLENPRTINIPMPLDDEGYLDRVCPAPDCASRFKALFQDWRDKVPDEAAWCAICGRSDRPQLFNTNEQDEYIKTQALRHLQSELDDVFRRTTPRSQRAGIIEMSLTYKPGAPIVAVPYEATAVLDQQSVCERCGCHYSSLGAAFFCPACGHNSALTTLRDALETVGKSMKLVDDLPRLMDDRGTAADLARHLTEDALVRIWASFQRFAEAAYGESFPERAHPRLNAFQNLEESAAIWGQAIGRTYADMLSSDEHRDLVRLVQQRHLLAHQEGLVDQRYVDRSGDKTYRVGQRLVLRPAAVLRLVEIVERLSTELRALVR